MKRSLLLLTFLFILPFTLIAGGLSTNWGEIIIQGLETGRTYDLNKTSNVPFTIKNNFDSEAVINIKILIPGGKELKPGYQAIEDTSWIRVATKELRLEPGQEGKVKLLLKIPKKEKYLGKKYQFWVWSYTVEKAVGVGLKSRVLLEIKQ